MESVFLGIDPGMTGAIALIHGTAGLAVYDFGGGGRDLDVLQKLSMNLHLYDVRCYIERVSSRPGQGVVSVFKFGTNFGQWIGRLEALKIPYDFVTPQKWQKEVFGATPKIYKTVKGKKKIDTKAMSKAVVMQLFPDAHQYLIRKKDHNRADAILIAEYCRRFFTK